VLLVLDHILGTVDLGSQLHLIQVELLVQLQLEPEPELELELELEPELEPELEHKRCNQVRHHLSSHKVGIGLQFEWHRFGTPPER